MRVCVSMIDNSVDIHENDKTVIFSDNNRDTKI